MSNIILTNDQDNANNEFLDFLVNDDNFFVIQGAAGTGKSFLIKHLLETFYAKYSAYCLLLQQDVKTFDIKITATTNKAVSVVEAFLENMLTQRTDLEVCTIFSLLGLKVVNDNQSGKTTLSFTKSGSAVGAERPGMTTLVFIDEASFIGADLQEVIDAILNRQANAKIVYIGDKYQLAPVGEVYSAMDKLQCTKVSLDEVMRNGGHILETGTQFRKTVETGIFMPIKYNDTDVIHVDGPTFQRLVDSSFSSKHWDPSVSKILAWTNARVQKYNNHVRKANNRPELFEVGETVITNEYIKGATNFARSVDSEVTITAIDQTPLVHYDVAGHMVELDHSHIAFMPKDFKDVKVALKKLATEAKKTKDWRKYFEIKDNWLDLRPAYASSIHKSQGSTYDTVFLDLPDIGQNWEANSVARLLYVAITRAAKRVVCYGKLPPKYNG